MNQSLRHFLGIAALAATVAACTAGNKQPQLTEEGKARVEQDASAKKSDDAPDQLVEFEAPKNSAVAPSETRVLRQKHEAAKPASPSVAGAVMADADLVAPPQLDNEKYAHLDQNGVTQVTQHPVSTFSIDVDTGAYANVRRMLKAGQLPQQDAVRIEEMINYFGYDYPLPVDKNRPFSVTTEIAPSP